MIATSVDSLSGYPPSLCPSHSPTSAIAKDHPTIKLFALLTQVLFSLSRVAVGMVCEAGPSRWSITLHYRQLMSSPNPALSSDFSQPLAYHCRIGYDPPLGICISEKLEITLYHQHASKTFCLWPGKMPLQLVSSPVT